MLTAVKKVVLTPEIKTAIKQDQELQILIAKQLGKTNIVTVQRWLKYDHYALTVPMVLDKIREYLELPQEVVLTMVSNVEKKQAA